jgi:peroxiredoxin
MGPRMRRVVLSRQPLSKLAALLFGAAMVCLFMDEHGAASALLVLGYAGLCSEFQKYTGRLQFLVMLLLGTAIGVVLDIRYELLPLTTSAMLLSVAATVLRQAFMSRFTYVRFLYTEPLLLAAAIVCQVLAMNATSFTWDQWLAPFVPIAGAAMLTAGYVQDGITIRRKNRFGYRLQVGQPAPPIELPDQEGVMVKLSDYRGHHPVLLVFVRGDWCPGCHMMLRTYERRREEFLRKGVHVLAIGPDAIAVNKDMVSRFGVGYKLLSDDEQRVSRQFGVVYNNPLIEQGAEYAQGIPLPASFLVDKAGIIRYVSRPDRVGEFLDPELIFGVLGTLPNDAQDAWRGKRA